MTPRRLSSLIAEEIERIGITTSTFEPGIYFLYLEIITDYLPFNSCTSTFRLTGPDKQFANLRRIPPLCKTNKL